MRPGPASETLRNAEDSAAPRILVVDDNTDAATSLGRLLKLSGYEVRVAHNGPAAITLVEQFCPRVVLLDLGMPGMDGLETAGHIKKLNVGHHISLLAITGWGHDEDRQRTEAAGFDGHFVKPIKLAQLEAALERITKSERIKDEG